MSLSFSIAFLSAFAFAVFCPLHLAEVAGKPEGRVWPLPVLWVALTALAAWFAQILLTRLAA